MASLEHGGVGHGRDGHPPDCAAGPCWPSCYHAGCGTSFRGCCTDDAAGRLVSGAGLGYLVAAPAVRPVGRGRILPCPAAVPVQPPNKTPFSLVRDLCSPGPGAHRDGRTVPPRAAGPGQPDVPYGCRTAGPRYLPAGECHGQFPGHRVCPGSRAVLPGMPVSCCAEKKVCGIHCGSGCRPLIILP